MAHFGDSFLSGSVEGQSSAIGSAEKKRSLPHPGAGQRVKRCRPDQKSSRPRAPPGRVCPVREAAQRSTESPLKCSEHPRPRRIWQQVSVTVGLPGKDSTRLFLANPERKISVTLVFDVNFDDLLKAGLRPEAERFRPGCV